MTGFTIDQKVALEMCEQTLLDAVQIMKADTIKDRVIAYATIAVGVELALKQGDYGTDLVSHALMMGISNHAAAKRKKK